MAKIAELLQSKRLAAPLSETEGNNLAPALSKLAEGDVYPRSITAKDGCLYFLLKKGRSKYLGIIHVPSVNTPFKGENRPVEFEGQRLAFLLCPTSHENALILRQVLPFTAPTLVGLKKSAGCGDRLGLATPGHIRAIRQHHMFPILAQQSIREMTRTQRSPDEVMDDATWGVLQEGWRLGFGSDADHLKQFEDIDRCAAAGFLFYTIDPGDHVDNKADQDDVAVLKQKVDALPWQDLETTFADMMQRYLNGSIKLPGLTLSFDEVSLWAAAKYGRAVLHTRRMFTHLQQVMGDRPWELEMSVDETETPTSAAEHYFIANELKRLGVKWVSLAPRYIGRFEKGVDYIGDLKAFERSFAEHVAIAKALGPYKLSLHSGSDKFSVYPIASRLAGEMVHLKTAGTSYLEALRAVAGTEPALFRDILEFAFARYATDCATYHVSADTARVPHSSQLKDSELAGVLDMFDGREMLHVTFGSVLTTKDEQGRYLFRERLLNALKDNEEAHYAALEKHFNKHLSPFD